MQYFLAWDWHVSWRGERLKSLLRASTASQKIDLAFHQSMQTDVQSNVWIENKNDLLTLGATWTQYLDASGLAAWNRLLGWDNRASMGSTEQSIASLWRVEVSRVSPTLLRFASADGWEVSIRTNSLLLSSRTRTPPSSRKNAISASLLGRQVVASASWQKRSTRSQLGHLSDGASTSTG